MTPNARVTKSTTHTNRFSRSAQSKVLIAIAVSIRAPPMVGVPALGKCVTGPSSRTGWPTWFMVSRAIMRGPTINESTSAVSAPRIARIVR